MTKMKMKIRALIGALLASPLVAAQADEVAVAVAANFAGALAKIGDGFSFATGHTLKLTAGSTGKFYSQIVAGAPFDVLIAADDETPRKLVNEKRMASPARIAIGLTAELAVLTTELLLIVGRPIAWWIARTRPRLKPVWSALVAMPIVLPPSVLGFYSCSSPCTP